MWFLLIPASWSLWCGDSLLSPSDNNDKNRTPAHDAVLLPVRCGITRIKPTLQPNLTVFLVVSKATSMQRMKSVSMICLLRRQPTKRHANLARQHGARATQLSRGYQLEGMVSRKGMRMCLPSPAALAQDAVEATPKDSEPPPTTLTSTSTSALSAPDGDRTPFQGHRTRSSLISEQRMLSSLLSVRVEDAPQALLVNAVPYRPSFKRIKSDIIPLKHKFKQQQQQQQQRKKHDAQSGASTQHPPHAAPVHSGHHYDGNTALFKMLSQQAMTPLRAEQQQQQQQQQLQPQPYLPPQLYHGQQQQQPDGPQTRQSRVLGAVLFFGLSHLVKRNCLSGLRLRAKECPDQERQIRVPRNGQRAATVMATWHGRPHHLPLCLPPKLARRKERLGVNQLNILS
ncbi:uncharacterized protein MONBRDRAFT_24569 [Monosiga brevicollis MX1]|uniref:Uncharacterized protein n=1 Tax=Monosiga brevicollis TaxID=81824 RepID=A9UWU4_MONBE|nr:uncharacterized protein MONBRDRAFT_24569 [Monosiga brevicollis MX1]EDQ90102.1 predicted protein [Monosiga brevicollis MX1]|eukprot:XP_001744869.1 hypothetical protein [Monosiga brevicollis MX1]